MKNPRVGERIAIYSPEREIGQVRAVEGEMLEIDFGGSTTGFVHHKQCRRFRAKDRIWVFVNSDGALPEGVVKTDPGPIEDRVRTPKGSWREFVSARAGK